MGPTPTPASERQASVLLSDALLDCCWEATLHHHCILVLDYSMTLVAVIQFEAIKASQVGCRL